MMQILSMDDIWSNFAALLDDPTKDEEDYHQYMVRFPALIPTWFPIDNVVYSKFPLGSQHVTDFAFARDDTPGFRWNFIEIERPHDKLFTKAGNPTARLVHALRQLHDWGAWFQENRDYVAKYFPHAERVERFGLTEPHLTLVIGRRENITIWERPVLRRFGGNISIRTFDSLKQELRSGWVYDHDNKPLRCCSFRNQSLTELSRMHVEVQYKVEQVNE